MLRKKHQKLIQYLQQTFIKYSKQIDINEDCDLTVLALFSKPTMAVVYIIYSVDDTLKVCCNTQVTCSQFNTRYLSLALICWNVIRCVHEHQLWTEVQTEVLDLNLLLYAGHIFMSIDLAVLCPCRVSVSLNSNYLGTMHC